MIINKVRLQHFCKFTEFETELNNDLALISGKNETGKSTIRNFIMWVLTDKFPDGSSAADIRPHDADGVDKDFLEVGGDMWVTCGAGKQYKLTKIQKQKWVKHTGSIEATYEGNVNEFAINDIPKKQKEFNEFLAQNIGNGNVLNFGMNPQAFLGLAAKKRREILLTFEQDFSDADVIKKNPDLAPVLPLLEEGTPDELVKRCNSRIRQYNDKLESIPVRIDELEMQKRDVDATAIRAEIKELEKVLKDKESEIESLEQDLKKSSKIKEEIMELKYQMSAIAMRDGGELEELKRGLKAELAGTQDGLRITSEKIDWYEKNIESLEQRIKEGNEQGQNINSGYKEVKAEVFDEDAVTCKYCGQKLPKKTVELRRKNFERDKNAKLSNMLEMAKSLKTNISGWEEELAKYREAREGLIPVFNEAKDKIHKLNEQLASLPEEAEHSEEWLKCNGELKAKEIASQSLLEAESAIQRKREEAQEVRDEISEKKSKLTDADINKSLDYRIGSLKHEQEKFAQSVADEMKVREMIKAFQKAKVEMLTDKINSHFKVIKWRMFRQLIGNADGYEEVCEALVNGSNYFTTLNHGNRILAEVDVCEAFQGVAGVNLPVFIDDAESLDAERLPKLDRQLIVLRRTDDEHLTVK